MEVPNFPWKEPVPSYVQADEIRNYLNNYVDQFGLRQLIKTCHNVESVEFLENSQTFRVTVKNVSTEEVITKG